MNILKLGAKGKEVETLQTFLGIKADGDFGPKTEAAVKAWQSAHKINPDGIVGPLTWKAMGIATTDVSERNIDTALDIKEKFLPKGQYFPGPTRKQWVFIHHTAGWNDPFSTISSWGRDTRGEVATEFVIGGPSIKGDDNKHDGVVVQAFPQGGWGWHLGTGRSAMHSNSVGIEVCNFGQLTKGGYKKDGKWVALKPDSYYTYVGTEAHPDQIVELEKPFRGYTHWHKYSDKQIEALRQLILYIAERDSIDVTKGLPDLIREKGAFAAFDLLDVKLASNTPGTWSHTNVLAGKVDMFPQPELVEMLLNL